VVEALATTVESVVGAGSTPGSESVDGENAMDDTIASRHWGSTLRRTAAKRCACVAQGVGFTVVDTYAARSVVVTIPIAVPSSSTTGMWWIPASSMRFATVSIGS
jgi:hypothetical protein